MEHKTPKLTLIKGGKKDKESSRLPKIALAIVILFLSFILLSLLLEM